MLSSNVLRKVLKFDFGRVGAGVENTRIARTDFLLYCRSEPFHVLTLAKDTERRRNHSQIDEERPLANVFETQPHFLRMDLLHVVAIRIIASAQDLTFVWKTDGRI